MNISVTPACPSNLLISWAPLTPKELRASASNSSYQVFYSPIVGEGGNSMEEVPYSQFSAMVSNRKGRAGWVWLVKKESGKGTA